MERATESEAQTVLSLILSSLEPQASDEAPERGALAELRLGEHTKSELAALLAMLRDAERAERPGALLRTVVARLAGVLGAARCSVVAAAPGSASARVIATHEPAPDEEPLALDLAKYPEIREALAGGRVVHVESLHADPLLAPVRPALAGLPDASILVAPIRVAGAVAGALFIRGGDASRRFAARKVRLAATAAALAGEALSRAVAREALGREARRASLEREIIRARYELAREYADLLENTSDGVFALAPSGAIAAVNRRAQEITGYARAELVGKPFGRIVPEEELRAILAMRGMEEPGELERYHVHIDDRRGERRSVSLSIQRLDSGERIVSMRDNTLEKRLEERLTAANERLRRLSEMKNAFLASAAHELRTPLAVALGSLRAVEAAGLGGAPAAALADARECLEELQAVVADMLDLTRLESGRMALRAAEGDLAQAARKAVARLRGEAEARGVAIEMAGEPALAAVFDPSRIAQVFTNLLANALKFTPRGGRVTVRLTAEEEGEAWIEVSDTGPGIPEARLEEVFEEFAQAGRDADGRGSGLGLAIVRRIAQAHGGAATAHRSAEGGALLRVRLPRSPAARAAA